jgi:thiazole biosynthesis adenylyltransferase ThiF
MPSSGSSALPSLSFSEDEILRYSRHILLPELGARGQAKLRESSVLIIGAGGLGSPALLYLAAAGVGHITVIDGDTVDLSNLQRQIAHSTADVGTPKVESARAAALAINPNIAFTAIHDRITAESAPDLITKHDLVLDGSDNFTTRYLVNDACHFANVPLISAAVFRFEGQLTTFTRDKTCPCYRCLFPKIPATGTVPSCSEAGVLGAVVGVLGTLQATEAIKLLTGIGKPLAGRLLRLDALAMDIQTFAFERDETCPLCGKQPTITTLIEESGPACEV